MARLDADSICRVMGAAGSARNGRRRRPAATDGSVERARADCERSATAPSDIRRIAARLFAGQRYPGRHPHRCAPERVLDHMGGDIRGPYPRSGSTGSVRDAFTDRAYSSGAGARSRATGALGISAWHLAPEAETATTHGSGSASATRRARTACPSSPSTRGVNGPTAGGPCTRSGRMAVVGVTTPRTAIRMRALASETASGAR